jgi:hypothetical protein
MLHTYAVKFDVTENPKKFLVVLGKQGHWKSEYNR